MFWFVVGCVSEVQVVRVCVLFRVGCVSEAQVVRVRVLFVLVVLVCERARQRSQRGQINFDGAQFTLQLKKTNS